MLLSYNKKTATNVFLFFHFFNKFGYASIHYIKYKTISVEAVVAQGNKRVTLNAKGCGFDSYLRKQYI